MKNIFKCLVICVLGVFAAGCSSNDEPTVDLNVVYTPSDVPATGGTVSFTVQTTGTWAAALVNQANSSWVTAIQPAAGTGSQQVNATIAANTSSEVRTAAIRVTVGDLKKEITIRQLGQAPADAGDIFGDDFNQCPDNEVPLTVPTITGASSYQWYKNGAAINGATAKDYSVTATGTYTVAGVNTNGTGTPSAAKVVTIYDCNIPKPDVPVITGDAQNVCPSVSVRLTAETTNALAYEWFRNGASVLVTTDSFYNVTESGTYTVTAKNAKGTSDESVAHVVTINACPMTIDDLLGDWSVDEIEATEDGGTKITYIISITKVDNSSIRISNFSDSEGSITATVDLTVGAEKIMVNAQELIFPPAVTTKVFMAAMATGNMSADINANFPPVAIIKSNGKLVIRLWSGYTETVDGQVIPYSYYTYAKNSSGEYDGYYYYTVGTTWTKK